MVTALWILYDTLALWWTSLLQRTMTSKEKVVLLSIGFAVALYGGYFELKDQWIRDSMRQTLDAIAAKVGVPPDIPPSELPLAVSQIKQNADALAAAAYPLTDAQQAQIQSAFSELVQQIEHGPSWPWIGCCRITVDAASSNEALQHRIISIAQRAGCQASAPIGAHERLRSDHSIIVLANASNNSAGRQAVGTEADRLVPALRKPPLNLDIDRGNKMTPEGNIYFEVGANSASAAK